MHSLSIKDHQALLSAIESMCSIFRGPDDRLCRFIQKGSFLATLKALSIRVNFDPPDVLKQIADITDNYSAAPAFYEELGEAYVRFFINAEGGIIAPLYHSCYESEGALLMGKAAEDMQRRLASYGLYLAEDMHEPPDHLSIELEFLYFLLESGRTKGNGAFLEEAAAFAGHTMIPWLRKLHQRLSLAAPGHFYTLVAACLLSMLKLIASRKAFPTGLNGTPL